MLRDKMIDRWVEELDKEILDLQALREEVTGDQANEVVRTLTDPDYRAEVGSIGDGIRSRRKSAGMTQDDLADEIGKQPKQRSGPLSAGDGLPALMRQTRKEMV